jgi:hypothetical protein
LLNSLFRSISVLSSGQNPDPKVTATAESALHSDAMAIQGGQNVVLCASPAVVVVALVGVITEAELVKSSVVV